MFTTDDIIALASSYGFAATVIGNEVHVACNGLAASHMLGDIIDAGGTYLGAIEGKARPMGERADSYLIVRRFTA